ncbi:hypothetical protein AWB75_06800 [Caballeronia catudaia]|uniref:Uncharacterized protein n=1 Tax=Caballeronia catudaia TaxID=1777136 RepID=A0A158DIH4_9BURK|nr:hypothetical protein AWB75_06800 [Caballeronia catudaia]
MLTGRFEHRLMRSNAIRWTARRHMLILINLILLAIGASVFTPTRKSISAAFSSRRARAIPHWRDVNALLPVVRTNLIMRRNDKDARGTAKRRIRNARLTNPVLLPVGGRNLSAAASWMGTSRIATGLGAHCDCESRRDAELPSREVMLFHPPPKTAPCCGKPIRQCFNFTFPKYKLNVDLVDEWM